MNGITLMLISIVVLSAGYLVVGKWLAKKWGIDPKAKTPAYALEDGVDYVPADTNVVFGHQFASIAGAGPINGPIQAAIFGWVPVLLWILIGGVFFGAVQDFASMYASVKSKGHGIGMIIEDHIGKTGKKLFLLFCWLFCILVVAAFADVVAGTFNGFLLAEDGSISTIEANCNHEDQQIGVQVVSWLKQSPYRNHAGNQDIGEDNQMPGVSANVHRKFHADPYGCDKHDQSDRGIDPFVQFSIAEDKSENNRFDNE